MQLAVCILFLPWLIIVLEQTLKIQGEFWIAPEPIWRYLGGTIAIFSGTLKFPATPVVSVLLTILTAFALIRANTIWSAVRNLWHRRQVSPKASLRPLVVNKPNVILFMIFFSSLLLPAVVSSLSQPIFLPRGLIFSSILFYILGAAGLTSLHNPLKGIIAFILIASLTINLIIYYVYLSRGITWGNWKSVEPLF